MFLKTELRHFLKHENIFFVSEFGFFLIDFE